MFRRKASRQACALGLAHQPVEEVVGQGRLHGQLADGIVDMLAAPFEPRMDPARKSAELQEDGFAVFARLRVPAQGIGQGARAEGLLPSRDPVEPGIDRAGDVADERLVRGKSVDVIDDLFRRQLLPAGLEIGQDAFADAGELGFGEPGLDPGRRLFIEPKPGMPAACSGRDDMDREFGRGRGLPPLIGRQPAVVEAGRIRQLDRALPLPALERETGRGEDSSSPPGNP